MTTAAFPDPDLQVRLRPLQASDLDRVMELEAELFPGETWTRESYLEELALPNRIYIAALAHRPGTGERLVGWAGVSLGDDAEIMTVGTDPTHQRQGIGRRLLRALIAEAKKRGCERAMLEVREDNEPARHLYDTEGFHRITVRKGYYRADGQDALVMGRTLNVDTDAARRAAVMVDADMLAAELEGANPPAVLDVRWTLDQADGRADFEEGHIPGAVYVDLLGELVGAGEPRLGRHPLPDVVTLEAALRSWGVRKGQAIVLVDDYAGVSAARGWWVLRWGGLTDVRVLDGGLSAWRLGGRDEETGAAAPVRGDAELPYARGGACGMPVSEIEDIEEIARQGCLIDVRDPGRYTGQNEPDEPRAGHVPGAHHAFYEELITEDGYLVPAGVIRRHFAKVGLNPDRAEQRWTLQCGTGVTATYAVMALTSVGVVPRLWPGSWSQWAHDPVRPLHTGHAA